MVQITGKLSVVLILAVAIAPVVSLPLPVTGTSDSENPHDASTSAIQHKFPPKMERKIEAKVWVYDQL